MKDEENLDTVFGSSAKKKVAWRRCSKLRDVFRINAYNSAVYGLEVHERNS
jgi:hypothetical protein